MKEHKNISFPKKGMQRNTSVHLLDENAYIFMLNGNNEAQDGQRLNLTAEPSNLLGVQFSSGYKAIGFKNDLLSGRTYYILTNPETGFSSIGYVTSLAQEVYGADEELNCADCGHANNPGTPLEGQTQTPAAVYVEIISDADCEGNLNLSIDYPVKSIEIKTEKLGTVIYWTDNFNPPRYINLDRLEQYTQTEEPCTDNITPVCLDVDKMRMFPIHTILDIQPETIQTGGQLRLGTYEFMGAYCDEAGNEISEYYSITNPVSIFDLSNRTLSQPELDSRTNFAIKLMVADLDTRFKYYKVVVMQRTDVVQTQSYFVEGIHPTTDNTVIYTGETNKQRTTLEHIMAVKIRYSRVKGITASNGYMFPYGLTGKPSLNLQPVVNLFSQFLKWNTAIAKEDLYENGIATSLYKGYNRDEIYPFGFRTLHKDGSKSAIFPFVGRQATVRPEGDDDLSNHYDMDEVSPDSQDRKSIEANLNTCIDVDRTKRWQYYNDAKEDENPCYDEDIPVNTVYEDITKICVVEGVATAAGATFSITETEDFSNLTGFVEDAIENGTCFPVEDCDSPIANAYPFCDYLDLACYTDQNCEPKFDSETCTDPELIEEQLLVAGVTGEVINKIEKDFPEEYALVKPPETCLLYATDSETGKLQRNTDFENNYMPCNPTVYERDYNYTNESCSYSDDIQNIANPNTAIQPYFHYYYGAATATELETPKITQDLGAGWSNKIHKGVLWFKGYTLGRQRFILEVSKQLDPKKDDNISDPNGAAGQVVRMSLYNKCTSPTYLFAELINLTAGARYLLEVNNGHLFLTNETTTFDLGLFTGTEFFVAVDNKIVAENVPTVRDVVGGIPVCDDYIIKYRTAPTDGCFGIVTRGIEYSRIDVTYESIVLNKRQTYQSTCEFEIPIIQNCKALPYKKGDFAYWESTETYPDNKELYDSSSLIIAPEDIPEEYQAAFEANFVDEIAASYKLKDTVNLRCQPIRHFKMPDNKVAPFMWSDRLAPFSSSIIFPLGISLDDMLVNSFLDIALKNELISQEQRDAIVGYEIVRGNRSSNKSVEASGYLYDMRTYEKDDKDILYPNYPYNDLGEDKLNYADKGRTTLVQHNSAQNSNFTFHSPETDFNRIQIPSELKVEGYVFGQSRGNFVDVENHPNWVITGTKAKTVATLLAVLESAAELAIRLAEAGENYRVAFFGGPAGGGTSVNPVGTGLSIAASALGLAGQVVEVGRKRYEWLQIFRNLGNPHNFAYYYTSEGYYNYLQTLQQEDNLVRGLNIGKNLIEGNHITTNEVTGERVQINNLNRERSVFLSLGNDYPLVWDEGYNEYDNNYVDSSASSLTYSSELRDCEDGTGKELRKNIASPYVKLKNYVSAQYGKIDSVQWLTTGYKSDLLNPESSNCNIVFGGDTFISRYWLKRKMPLFTTDAMNVASLTPFDYKKYGNIGKQPRFYCDYELGGEDSSGSAIFPNIDSDYHFDCQSGARKMYVKAPSKFYLFYYGIPGILCETEINTNFRYGGKEPENNFYPNVGDKIEWTQEKNVSIKEPNSFFYNTAYSRPVTQTPYDQLLATYKKSEQDKRNDAPNGTIYSLPDNSENDTFDPWLIYRPLDFYEFPKKYGRLIQLKDLESATILGRFENEYAVFNAIDTFGDKQNSVTFEIGTGGIFAKRPLEAKATDLGYGGTQHTDMVSTPFGHFWVDAARGQIFMLDNTGRDLQAISDFTGKEESGLKNWFREHLPFKILKALPQIDVDNKFKGIGISMGWDARFGRVFFTKRDYILRTGIDKNDFTFENNKLFYKEEETGFDNISLFDDVSWTLAYKAMDGSWVSYYSFAPDYYVAQNNYFQTGYNDTENVWNHLLTNRSYGVFRGTKYPFAIELPVKNEQVNKMLTTVSLNIEAKRWNNEWDFAQNKNIGFNRAAIWNNTNNSGILNLVQGKYLSQITAYPKTNANNTQDILWTALEGKQTFNYFYNRMSNQDSGVPAWIWDKNMIEKQIDPRAVSFKGKKTLERLRGQFFSLRIEFDADSRYQMTLKDAITTAQNY